MKRYLVAFALFATLGFSPLVQPAQAWVRVGIGIGFPIYVGPGPYYYGYPYYPYYYPPAVVAAPPAVVYQTAPSTTVVRSPGETIPPPASAAPAPAPTPVASAAPAPPPVVSPNLAPPPLPPVSNVIPVSNDPVISAMIRQLSDASEAVRRDAAVELGKQKAQTAVEPLMNVLAKDTSPVAREAAARGLGLIAAPRSLNALIFAAQADNDREVRRSAQFAVEVIRSNLRGN